MTATAATNVSLAYNHMTSDGGYPRYYTILCYGI